MSLDQWFGGAVEHRERLSLLAWMAKVSSPLDGSARALCSGASVISMTTEPDGGMTHAEPTGCHLNVCKSCGLAIRKIRRIQILACSKGLEKVNWNLNGGAGFHHTPSGSNVERRFGRLGHASTWTQAARASRLTLSVRWGLEVPRCLTTKAHRSTRAAGRIVWGKRRLWQTQAPLGHAAWPISDSNTLRRQPRFWGMMKSFLQWVSYISSPRKV